MTLQIASGLAIDEVRSHAVHHARTRDGRPVACTEGAAPHDDIAGSPSRSSDLALLALDTPVAVRIPPVAQRDAPAGRGNMVRCLRNLAAERSDDTAFVQLSEGDVPQASLTYAQLDRRARAIAAVLQDMRVGGQNIVLAYPPGLDFIAAFFGALYAGCVAVPAYPPRMRTLDRFHSIAGDAGATVALSTAGTVAFMKSIDDRTAAVHWIATDEIDAAPGRWIERALAPDALAMIQYTSGSTSQPKGVMLSHANIVANMRAINSAFSIGRDTKAVFWLPACHDMGLIGGVLAPVYCGFPSTIIAPAMFVRDPFLWLDAISRFGATVSGGPNFAYDLCTRKITAEQRAVLDLSSWKVAFIGAEAVDPATLARFAKAFARCGFRTSSFYPCYGLAEATLMVTGPRVGSGAAVSAFRDDALVRNVVESLPDHASGARLLVGCGAPVDSLSVAIVEPATGARAPSDRIGEIWVAGESIGKGYWRKPEKTASTFNARLCDADGTTFLRTGDLGFMHEQQLYITGRIDDLIIIRGLNHHPQDIEATARQSHPLLVSGLGAAFAVEESGRAASGPRTRGRP